MVLFCKPRVCGEKQILENALMIGLGSPPRMRGKVGLCRDGLLKLGITPAYAGKRRLHTSVLPWRRDHPRVCGEKAAILRAVWVPMGSPPHMRGKVLDNLGGNRGVRITPAYAGKRAEQAHSMSCSEDHPRVCGEKPCRWHHPAIQLGSPPRMRGKGVFRIVNAEQTGITPAYAGKSGSLS